MIPPQLASCSKKLKLTYFPIRGRGEMIRYILHLAKVDFDDCHVQIADWDKNKPMGAPFGLLPYVQLEDGRVLSQSVTIARYFAHKYGFAGKDSYEKAQCDQYVDGIQDLYIPLRPVLGPLFREGKEKAMEAYWPFETNTLFVLMSRYTKFLEANKTGFLVGNSLTWADLVVAEMLDKFYTAFDPKLFANHPVMKKHHDMVYNLPVIKQFATKRGVMPF